MVADFVVMDEEAKLAMTYFIDDYEKEKGERVHEKRNDRYVGP